MLFLHEVGNVSNIQTELFVFASYPSGIVCMYYILRCYCSLAYSMSIIVFFFFILAEVCDCKLMFVINKKFGSCH